MSSNDPSLPAGSAAPDFAAPPQYPAPAYSPGLAAAAPTPAPQPAFAAGPEAYPGAPGAAAGYPYPGAPAAAGGVPSQPAYPTWAAASPPAAYPPAPGTYPAYPAPPAQPVEHAPARALPSAPERVGRGLVFSLGGIVVGVVLTVVLWRLNFIASVTSFAMAYSAIWLYVKGSGRAPARGAAGLIGVILVGVLACLAAINVSDTLAYLAQEYPDATGAEQTQAVLDSLVSPEVWEQYTREILMYLLFAGLGTFGLIRQLGRARRAR